MVGIASAACESDTFSAPLATPALTVANRSTTGRSSGWTTTGDKSEVGREGPDCWNDEHPGSAPGGWSPFPRHRQHESPGLGRQPGKYGWVVIDHSFSESDRDAVYQVIHQRRDMRRFVAGSTVRLDVLRRVLAAAHAAPSVGLMQPWRFIRITDIALRTRVHRQVDEERVMTAAALGERAQEFLALKVEGIRDCAELIVVALSDDRERHVFGRRTMPHMDLASVSCAIQNLWLAARAEGLGMGWVSLFDPKMLADLLAFPPGAEPVAILCLGPVPDFPRQPELESDQWTVGRPLAEFVSENRWPGTESELPPRICSETD